jgi:hypothetical protein
VRQGIGLGAAAKIDGLKKDAMAKRAEALLAGKSWLSTLLPLTVAAGSGSKGRSQCLAESGNRAGLQKPARLLCRLTAFCEDFCPIPINRR